MTSQASSSSTGDFGAVRVFSGEAEDSREYKRWKTWCMNKMLTMEKLGETARGAFIMTLLTGKAYETIEHLEPSEYQKKDGDQVIWKLLDARFPKQDTVDELNETLTDVFGLRAREGETMKQWAARATELFDRCSRKAGVSFPEEAKGWILLNRAQLTDEQRAVVVSRARGDLKRESIASALRSCYPEMTIKRKGVAMVDEALAVADSGVEDDPVIPGDDFDDVQQLLADHLFGPDEEQVEELLEADVAEVLAATWRERRQELNRLQKTRQYGKIREVKKAYRVEVEELKRASTCHRCGQKGHWSRECRNPPSNAKGGSKGKPSQPSGAAIVETPPVAEEVDFVASVQDCLTLKQQVYQLIADRQPTIPTTALPEILLVSSPGYGVLDSGCGRTIIGRTTLNEFITLWRQRGIPVPELTPETHQFRFGNGHVETSKESISLPVWLAGRHGLIKAAIVQGSAPLLISRTALKALKASLDFEFDQLKLFGGEVIDLKTNSAGQYIVNLLESKTKNEQPKSEFTEVMISTPEVCSDESQEPPEDRSEVNQPLPSSEPVVNETSPVKGTDPCEPLCWSQEDSGGQYIPWVSKVGPTWCKVRRRVVIDAVSRRVLADHVFNKPINQRDTIHPLPQNSGHVITRFFHTDENCDSSDALGESPSQWQPTSKQSRQLTAQLKTCQEVLASAKNTVLVQEVFSPPRFKTAVEEKGFKGHSFDLVNGFDLSTRADRKRVEKSLETEPPELLVLCPPCTDEGGWFHLNSTRWERWEYLRRVARSRSFIRWCCKLFREQLARGKRAVFEHPTGAKTWSYAEVQSLCRKHHTVKLHMCRYGMQLPGSDNLIRKSTRLLVSHDDMQELAKLCPGPPEHETHDTVKGSWPGVPSVSKYVSRYPPQFVEAVLNTVPAYRNHQPSEVLIVENDDLGPTQWSQVDAVAQLMDKSDDELKPVLMKLHKNLGHPPNHDLVRVLKNSQASDQAIRLAKELTCPICESQRKPSVPLPAQPRKISEVNQQVGLDIKHLRGWLPNQKIKALNLVDYASGFQKMIPFFVTETSAVIRQLFQEHWVTWLGPPKDLILDSAKTNLGEGMAGPTELQGTNVRPIAAGAHWQLGKVESHGGWFARVLDKLVEEFHPQNREDWLQCVHHAHIKNQMLQNHGFSPHQFVFGKNPHVPEDLLSEPLNVISATASLTEQGLARAQAMRTAARQALIQLQDDRSIRVALNARPRVNHDYQPGDLVAYWRDQKWVKGTLQLGGRWWGTAVVLGKVGRNFVLMHRRQVIRCAPEQIRPATSEEKTVLATPQADMLGIKDMIEQGNIRSQQFLDLLSQSYPPAVNPANTGPSEGRIQEAQEEEANRSVAAPRIADNAQNTAEAPSTENTPLEVDERMNEPRVEPTNQDNPTAVADQKSSVPSGSYGPVRSRRVTGKDGPLSLWRPAAMKQDDFIEVMKEVVPHLIDQTMEAAEPSSGSGIKRPLEPSSESVPEEPPESRARNLGTETLTTEVLAVQCDESASPIHEALSVEDCHQLISCIEHDEFEVCMSEYLKKKMAKELPHSNNPPELQKMVDDGKRTEWSTITSKPNAVKIHYGKRAAEIRSKHADRFIGSRFVLTRKPIEEGAHVDPNDWSTFTVKGRWCLQGHLDPDLESKAQEGMLKSPTLSQIGRMTLMQVISSMKWDLQLGDIKGAFLEAGPLDDRFRPLFASTPAGGIPGLPSDAVIEVCGNVYGQNDAPAAWFKEFATFVKNIGWTQSKLDQCLFTLRDPSRPGKLIAVMGVHVDDTALGGDVQDPFFQTCLKKLKERFPYRKWRVNTGEFCGAWYTQQPDKSIVMTMQGFAENIRPVNVPKGAPIDAHLTPSQIKVLRAVNGSMNWLASQSRPDLSVQTSFSQQSFPQPSIKDLRMINHAVRHAKQESSLGVTFKSISPEELTVICHSDSAFANLGTHTQAGYVIGFTQKQMQEGYESFWNPACWRSYKLPRAVSSTLAAESQAMATSTGTVEWLLLLLSEILDGPLDIPKCREVLQKRRPILVTDCKSLYDHLHSPSSPTSIEDRRTSIDVVIIRESARLMQAHVRWVPTDRMLADAMTKDAGGPIDLLRSCIRRSRYQINPEDSVLEFQALERDRRLMERCKKQVHNSQSAHISS